MNVIKGDTFRRAIEIIDDSTGSSPDMGDLAVRWVFWSGEDEPILDLTLDSSELAVVGSDIVLSVPASETATWEPKQYQFEMKVRITSESRVAQVKTGTLTVVGSRIKDQV